MIHSPLAQLVISRIVQFARQPEVLFWTYGFPLIMAIVLGLAFRNKPEETIMFDVIEGDAAQFVQNAIGDDTRFKVQTHPRDVALDRLRTNKTPFVIDRSKDGAIVYHFDKTNPDGRTARAIIDDALQRAAGRRDAIASIEKTETAPGSRYIDFLIPGLIGMNLMGGGLWGVGFVLVDMRVRNLLKRLLATPMRRSDFLMSLVGVRVLFFIPEMGFLLLAAHWIFDVPVRGSFLAVVIIALVGTLAFAGLGLLTACRAKRIETISGLMNLVMVPMWLMSGIFFSTERFPDALQPVVQALPLTHLISALRSVILDGDGLASQAVPLLILALWGGVSFILAMRWFRWTQ